MNKAIVLLVAVFSVLSAYAAHDPEEHRVRVTKTDGTVIEGYTETNFLNTTFPKVAKFTFSTKYKGETTTYTSEDVKRVEFVNLSIDSIPLVFESVQAESKVPLTSGKTPKLFKTPVFLRLYYVGKNVKGYTLPHTSVTNTPSVSSILDGWRYYYMVNGSNVAKAYWYDMTGVVVGIKKRLKICLTDFPEVIKMLDDNEISTKEFRKDPTMLLPLMDKTYKKQ